MTPPVLDLTILIELHGRFVVASAIDIDTIIPCSRLTLKNERLARLSICLEKSGLGSKFQVCTTPLSSWATRQVRVLALVPSWLIAVDNLRSTLLTSSRIRVFLHTCSQGEASSHKLLVVTTLL
jgi:hypothetical protein